MSTLKSKPMFMLLTKADLGYTSKSRQSKGQPIVGLGDVLPSGALDEQNLSRFDLSDIPSEKLTETQLNPGDLLVGIYWNEDSPPLALIRERDQACWHSISCVRLRVNDEVCMPEYLYWYIRFLHQTKVASKYYIGSTTQIDKLLLRPFLSIKVPVPALSEQKRIVERVESFKGMHVKTWLLNQHVKQVVKELFEKWYQQEEMSHGSKKVRLRDIVRSELLQFLLTLDEWDVGVERFIRLVDQQIDVCVDPSILYFILSSDECKAYFRMNGVHHMMNYEMNIPPLERQASFKKTVEKLIKLQKKVNLQHQLINQQQMQELEELFEKS